MSTGNILFLALVLATFFSFIGIVGFVSLTSRPREPARTAPPADASPVRT